MFERLKLFQLFHYLNSCLKDCAIHFDKKNYIRSSPSFFSSTGIDPGPGVFEVVHRIHDNPDHTDQQMYSCGSLPPKMRTGGCIDSHYHKLGELWEKSEGV